MNQLELDSYLNKISESLDINESLFEVAEKRYHSLGQWLTREESSVRKFSPAIYPQGSFNLGTVVKPYGKETEYDIDLVCCVDLTKVDVSQKTLKELIGQEIKAYFNANNFKNEPSNNRRCWTLEYSENAKFHIDILPSIPDATLYKSLLEREGIKNEWADHAIAITDKEHPNYNFKSENWPRSNPKGYGKWFYERMRVRLDENRRTLAKSVEQVPDYKIKTPLQRVIQILKRHRDVMFESDQDDKPISIIITTLAAKSYSNEASISEALKNIIKKMPDSIEEKDNRAFIPNPVDPLENFADKWPDHPERREKFMQWLAQVEDDVALWLSKDSKQEVGILLSERFGKNIVENALNESLPQPTLTNLPVVVPPSIVVPAHRKKPVWPMQLKYKATIEATFWKDGYRTQNIASGSSLPKKAHLRFQVKTDIPYTCKIYWQVVNTGAQASSANCLRGDFYDGEIKKGGKTKDEDTHYSGTHCIECFFVKNGVCVARSGDFLVVIT